MADPTSSPLDPIKTTTFFNPDGALSDPLVTQFPLKTPLERIQDSFALRNDKTPVLLMPIRVETRFMRIKHVYRMIPGKSQRYPSVADRRELWVRFFPDDLAVSTHEKAFTPDEIAAAKDYWNEIYAAGSDQDLHLGAWRVIAQSFGSPRAAYVVQTMTPTNYDEATGTFSGEPIFRAPEEKDESWTQAATSFVMPDKFVVLAYRNGIRKEVVGKTIPSDLQLGIDPSSEEEFVQENGSLSVPAGMKWMTDFAEAEKVGMAVRIELTSTWTLGMDRLIVVGLKLSEDETESHDLLERLFNHHHFSSGFAFVPQGTPTNNSEESDSGYNDEALSPDTSFGVERGKPLVKYVSNYKLRSDGQWFADALGLDYSVVEHIHKADGTDVQESMAMNRALWPATMQFAMRQMMHPLFTDQTIADTESFFKKWVTGRGHIPAFRIGDQPYGVLPTSAFSQWEYRLTDYSHRYHKKLLPLLQSMNQQWAALSEKVKSIGGNDVTDLDENFLEVIGLHASSVEFFQRFATGPDVIYGLERFYNSLTGRNYLSYATNTRSVEGMRNAGVVMNAEPFAATVVNADTNRHLNGPVADNAPLSETEPVQPLKGSSKNYLRWLIDSAYTALNSEDFRTVGADADAPTPRALLYLFLRHALLLEYANTSFDLLLEAGVVSISDRQLTDFTNVATRPLSFQEKLALKVQVEDQVLKYNGFDLSDGATQPIKLISDPNLVFDRSIEVDKLQLQINTEYERQIKVIEQGPVKWGDINQSFSQVSAQPIGAHIDSLIKMNDAKAAALKEVREAIAQLEKVPTARLERLLAEHLDLCSYRLDAWKTAIVEDRLYGHRGAGISRKKGIHLGAFGWLERVLPGDMPGVEVKELVRKDGKSLLSTSISDYDIVDQSPFLNTDVWKYIGTDATIGLDREEESGLIIAALREDPTNQGFIHGPSINHAVAAAILRAGYKADPDSSMAVNLNSRRVRIANYYIQGVRQGQELGALLGYRFERSMHDLSLKDGLGQPIALDQYLLEIRNKYPLVAGRVVESVGAVEAAEARNVMDGLKAVEDYRNFGGTAFLSGLAIADLTVRAAVIDLMKQLSDELDAVADLALSEAVYQLAQGRKERSNAVLRALNGEGTFPDIEIINTPRSGNAMTHRVIMHLDAPGANPTYWASRSIGALTEPKLNSFIGSMLPNPANIVFNVFLDQTGESGELTTTRATVRLTELGMQPLDFLYLVGRQMDNPQGTALSDRIAFVARSRKFQEDGGRIRVSFTERTGLASTDKTLAEIIAVVEALLDVLRSSRDLRPDDLLLPGEVAPEAGGTDITELRNRVDRALNGAGTPYSLRTVASHMKSYAILLAREDGIRYISLVRARMVQASYFNIENAIPITAYAREEENKAAILAQAEAVRDSLQSLFDTCLGMFDAAEAMEDGEAKVSAYQDVAKQMFGRDFRLMPCFAQRDPAGFEEAKSYGETGDLLAAGGDFPVEEWLHGTSRVRPALADYLRLSVLGEALHGAERLSPLTPLQFPHTRDATGNPNGRWTGIAFPEDYEMPGDVLSLVNSFPAGYSASNVQSGLVLDEWPEIIPRKTENTGLALHYNQPNAKAPQSLLLCVTPKETGNWDWETLVDILNETLDSAKQRAVDPTLIDTTVYAQFLPMLYASLTADEGFPTLDFARNLSPVLRGIFQSLKITDIPEQLRNVIIMDDNV